jgi:hypothetical protein
VTDLPIWITHYDVPEGHNYADMHLTGFRPIEPGDTDQYGNEYIWRCTSKDAE